MSKMLIYTEDRTTKIVSIALHYDDHSVDRAEVRVGDNFAIKYLHQKTLVALQGRVVDIFTNKFDQTTLKMDISSQYRSAIIFVVTDNIRGFLPVEPDAFLKLIEDYNNDTNGGSGNGDGGNNGGGGNGGNGNCDCGCGVVGDGVVDTVTEIVEQLTWSN